jgi:hypothetical protein
MVQQVMITVLKLVVCPRAKREQDGGSLRAQALEKIEAFTGHVFFPVGFVVGTVPTANSVNDGGSFTIHSWIANVLQTPRQIRNLHSLISQSKQDQQAVLHLQRPFFIFLTFLILTDIPFPLRCRRIQHLRNPLQVSLFKAEHESERSQKNNSRSKPETGHVKAMELLNSILRKDFSTERIAPVQRKVTMHEKGRFQSSAKEYHGAKSQKHGHMDQ